MHHGDSLLFGGNVSATVENINRFVNYARTLQGDEKGEAQVFCDRLFQAFGHDGYKEAGATLEFRIKKESGRGTQFADLIWKPRLLLEMKKGGGEEVFDGLADGRAGHLPSPSAVVGLPHGLPRSLVFRVLVVASDFADDDFGIERNGLEDDVEALPVLVRERQAEVEPVVVLAFAFDHGRRTMRRLQADHG